MLFLSRMMLFKKKNYFGLLAMVVVVALVLYLKVTEGEDDDMEILVKLPHTRLYIYSAVAVFKVYSAEAAEESKRNRKYNAVAINGFEVGSEHMPFPNKCCIMLQNMKIISTISSLKYTYGAKAIRRSFQFYCPVHHELSNLRSISLTFEDAACESNANNYKKITKPRDPGIKKGKQTIAVCAKVAYGDLNAKLLIEWLETLRFLGVDLVFAHTYMLNSLAGRVIQYYKRTGFVETMEFDLPEKELQEQIDTINRQGWNDEQVALFDCQTQLLLYDYVFVVDTDEFLVPTSNVSANGIRSLFEELFTRPQVATVHFQTVLHITSWGLVDPEHRLVIGKYINGTVPMIEREKLVYMPTKVDLGSIFTHRNTPFEGYTRKEVDPEKAVLHHFRSCRKNWLEPRRKYGAKRADWVEPRTMHMMTEKPDSFYFYMKEERYCFDFRRGRSGDIETLIDAITGHVEGTLTDIQ